MKKLLLLLVFLPLYIWGSEGMWLPCCLSKQTQQVMKEMGLELSSEQLYNPGGKALANAVVSFGGFVRVLLYLRMVWFLLTTIVGMMPFSSIVLWSMIICEMVL